MRAHMKKILLFSNPEIRYHIFHAHRWPTLFFTKEQEVALMETVEFNSEGYSKLHMNNVRNEQHIYSKFGHSSICDYNDMV